MAIIWNEYKDWETSESELEKTQERHVGALGRLDAMVTFEERFQHAYAQLEDQNDIEHMVALLSKDLEEIAGDNFNYVMLYLERILSEYTLNRELWALYTAYADTKCRQAQVRQALYRRASRNCPQELDFVLAYLRELEKNDADS
jgi:hypothetical protein